MNFKKQEEMDIGAAVKWTRHGATVTREGWNGKSMWVAMMAAGTSDDEESGFGNFLYMKTAQNTLVPWVASQTDLLAQDWQVC